LLSETLAETNPSPQLSQKGEYGYVCSYVAEPHPDLIPGHFIARCSTGAAREAFERQAEQDWETFLSLRARELRSGGRLVVVLAALNDDGISGLEDIFNRANAVLAEMSIQERFRLKSANEWCWELIQGEGRSSSLRSMPSGSSKT
jgi:SAM dependent carboxyl methyltransferase